MPDYHFQRVHPNVTNANYTAGFNIGGLFTFPGAMSQAGVATIDMIKARFTSSIQTTNLLVNVFRRPPIGTYTDFLAPAPNFQDYFDYLNTYTLSSPVSSGGTYTTYTLKDINERCLFNFGGTATSTILYVAVTIVTTTTNAVQANDFEFELVTVW